MNRRTNPSHWDEGASGREWSSERGRGGGEGGRGWSSDQVYGQGTPMQRGQYRDDQGSQRSYAAPADDERWNDFRDDGGHSRSDYNESRQQTQGDRYRDDRWNREHQFGQGFQQRHPRFGESRLASYGGVQQSFNLPDYQGTSYDSQDLARLRGGYRPDEESRRYADSRFGSPSSYGAYGYGSGSSPEGAGNYGSGGGGFGVHRGSSSDRSAAAQHSGKGPKGYSRSDDRIRDDVCERLTYDAEIDASDITVSVSQGEVTLAGEVEDRRAKRRAEDIIEEVSGVRDVHNQLRARRGFFGTVVAEMKGEEHSSDNVGKGPHSSAGTSSATAGSAPVRNGGSAVRG